MIDIELQYFSGCPNSQTMIENTKAAIAELGIDVKYKEVLVETPERASEKKFRGSPTLLINGSDFENMDEPEFSNLTCRYYHNGIPKKSSIKAFLLRKIIKQLSG